MFNKTLERRIDMIESRIDSLSKKIDQHCNLQDILGDQIVNISNTVDDISNDIYGDDNYIVTSIKNRFQNFEVFSGYKEAIRRKKELESQDGVTDVYICEIIDKSLK